MRRRAVGAASGGFVLRSDDRQRSLGDRGVKAVGRGMLAAMAKVSSRPPAIDATAMLGAVPLPILLLDGDNRFRFANHAAEQFLGLSMHQLSHMDLRDLLPADNPL